MAEIKAIDIRDLTPRHREPPRSSNSWFFVTEKTCDAQNIALGINETYEGGGIPLHNHEREEEIMLFLEGEGECVTDSEVLKLGPGVCVYAPPGCNHAIKNTGKAPLKFVFAFGPQLPEHRKE